MVRRLGLLFGGVLVALLAVGCSAGPAGGVEQSVEAACQEIYDGMEKMETALAEVSGSGSAEDLRAMVEVATTNLDALDGKVTNHEVKALWDPIAQLQRAGLQAAANEDQEGLMAAYLEMSDKYQAFAKVCPLVAEEG